MKLVSHYNSYRKRHKPIPVAPIIILQKRHFTYCISFPERVTRNVFMTSGGIAMEILKMLQSDLMVVLSTICGTLALLVYMTNTISHKRKLVLMLLEISAMFLMICDRRAYIYRGDTSSLGWWLVRISNFLVFFLTLVVICSFNLYLIDLYTNEGKLDSPPRRLKAATILALIGMALVIISQFTGFYYTFDEMNRYQRAPGFIICYLIPLSMLILQVSVIIQYRRVLNRSIWISLLLFTSLCLCASILQVFMYGVSLNNITIAAMAILLYVYALKDMTREVERAREMEIEYYKEEKAKEHALFEQTAEALASAIDAKDAYTHGLPNMATTERAKKHDWYINWIVRFLDMLIN